MRLFQLSTYFIFFIFAACQGPQRDKYPDGQVQAKIPFYNSLSKSYALQVVDLLSVENMVDFKGWAAKFFLAAKVHNNTINGLNPHLNTIRNRDGVYVASDELSLQLLTIYYHLENLAIFDEQVGAKDINTWPRNVAVQVNYIDPQMGRVLNNALYAGDLDALLLVPYTQGHLPVSVNAGILAHEHFHSLFHKAVMKPLAEKNTSALHADDNLIQSAFGIVNTEKIKASDAQTKDENYQSILLRGVNEGLADFWGWMYSKDENFVGRSVPIFEFVRRMDFSQSVMSDSCFEKSIEKGLEMQAAYDYGISLARNLRNIFLDLQKEKNWSFEQTKVVMGQAIIKSFVPLQKQFRAKASTELIIDLIIQQIPSDKVSKLSMKTFRCH